MHQKWLHTGLFHKLIEDLDRVKPLELMPNHMV